MEPAATYYASVLPPAAVHPVLSGETDADVAIVGGGIAGVSTALHLARRGIRAVVVEAQSVGSGASGRNGGQVLAGFSAGLDGIVRRNGMAAARALWAESVAAVELVRSLAGPQCDLQNGAVTVAIKPRHLSSFYEEARWLEGEFGYQGLEIWDKEVTRSIVRSPKYCGGLFDAAALHLNPLAFVRHLAELATAAGAALYEGSAVLRIDTEGPVKKIMTARGSVTARHVVLAANASLNGLYPWAARRIMPVASSVIATEPLPPEKLHDCLTRPLAVCDANIVLDYFRPTGDGRLVFGGLANYSGRPPANVAGVLGARLRSVFPQLADVRISHGWSGMIDISLNREPLIGEISPGVHLAQGFSGHGVALAARAGERIAAAIGGDTAAYQPYLPLARPVFPGGPLRTAALVLGMAWLRLKDRFA